MSRKKGLAIINRGFWPGCQTIGEALLQLAEEQAKYQPVTVITQSESDLRQLMDDAQRGKGVSVRDCKTWTTSASGLPKRIAEAIWFMLWTFYSLVRARPEMVYVSTNPPVVVPFIVALYCRLFRARYVYHLQDIHPEITNIVIPLNRIMFRILRALDNYTIRNAACIVTISGDMQEFIRQRSGTAKPIVLLDNPSLDVTPIPWEERTEGVVFCGNAGRVQRIPLLLEAIDTYLDGGGKLLFTFAGGGVYAGELKALAERHEQFVYLGLVPAAEAADLVNRNRWALLPLEDEVAKYAFPSKSSGYALSGAAVLAVCGKETSVARWVEQQNAGIVSEPDKQALLDCFGLLEGNGENRYRVPDELKETLRIPHFVQQLGEILGR